MQREPSYVPAALSALALTMLFLAGCGGSKAGADATSVPSVGPTSHVTRAVSGGLPRSIALDERWLRSASYTPQSYVLSRVRRGTVLIVFHTLCTGSADGHCQAVHVFRDRGARPIWVGHFAGVTALKPSPSGFTMTSIQYAPSDPLCCPSLPPRTTRYIWNGRGLTLANGAKAPSS